jgi:endonuclease YncB( thermonuclease family)
MGSCSPSQQWPQQASPSSEENQQRIQQLETVKIVKVSDGDTVRLSDGRQAQITGAR